MARVNNVGRYKGLIIGCLCAAGLASCGPLVEIGGADAPAPRIFDMDPAITAVESPWQSREVVLLVEDPTATSLLDKDRVAVRLPGGEIQYIGGLRLADRPARLIRRVITEDLDSVDRLTALGRGALDVPSDYRLKLIVRDFQINAAAIGQERSAVSLQALLIDASGTLLASEGFRHEADISSIQPSTAVASLSEGLGETAGQLKSWLLQTLSADMNSP